MTLRLVEPAFPPSDDDLGREAFFYWRYRGRDTHDIAQEITRRRWKVTEADVYNALSAYREAQRQGGNQ